MTASNATSPAANAQTIPDQTAEPRPASILLDEPLMEFRVTCRSRHHAVQFRDHLFSRGVIVDDVEGTDVVIAYQGDLTFIEAITSDAVFGNFADGASMAALLSVEKARLDGHLDTDRPGTTTGTISPSADEQA